MSHFRPIVDSTRIYAVILRQFAKFSGASLASAVLDFAVYVVLLDTVFLEDRTPKHVAMAVVFARAVSSLFNYSLNKWLVFRDDSRPVSVTATLRGAGRDIFVCSTLGTTALSVISGGHAVWAKVIVDGTLFVLSYLIQERWVFQDRNLEND